MKDFLFNLLPSIYRELDEAEGSPLRALLQVIEDERDRLEQETGQAYANWFVETCENGILPEIAQLTGPRSPFMRRAAVANTVASRRRKGTFVALERRVSDASGWPALASLLPAATSNDQPQLEVRVWRQTACAVENGAPFCVAPGRYTFHPMGFDTPLFHVPIASYDIERRMTLDNMPIRIDFTTPDPLTTPLSIEVAGQAGALEFCDLSQWDISAIAAAPPEQSAASLRAFVDPVRGRFIFQPAPGSDGETSADQFPDAAKLRVSYAWGLSADLGGGPYPRPPLPSPQGAWVGYVRHEATAALADSRIFPTVIDALEAFSKSACHGTITFTDSFTYDLPFEPIDASRWSCPQPCEGGHRLTLRAMDGQCPCLRGDLSVVASALGMRLTLDGLWIDGAIQPGGPLTLDVRHSTACPANGGPGAHHGIRALPGDHPGLIVRLESSICGPILLPQVCSGLEAHNSIIESIAARTATSVVRADAETEAAHSAIFATTLVHSTVLDTVSGSAVDPETSVESIVGADHTSSPLFASTCYGDPDYARLLPTASPDVLSGAANGSELGAFHSVNEPLRRRQAEAARKEFTPAHLESRIVYET